MLATNKNKNKDKNKNLSSDLPYASRAYQIADPKKESKKKNVQQRCVGHGSKRQDHSEKKRKNSHHNQKDVEKDKPQISVCKIEDDNGENTACKSLGYSVYLIYVQK
jgi:hypothetical protein